MIDFSTITPAMVVSFFAALLMVLAGGTVHEYGHAISAKWFGDRTAASMGRLTLNPIPHIHPVMTIAMPLMFGMIFGIPFGGMRPVPVQPMRMRDPARHMALCALAGPGFQMLFVLGLLVILLLATPFMAPNSIGTWALMVGILINTVIAVFNLIPIPPLDGSRVLRLFLPDDLRRQYDSVGPMVGIGIVIFLVMTGAIRPILVPVYNAAADVLVWFYGNFSLVVLTGPLTY